MPESGVLFLHTDRNQFLAYYNFDFQFGSHIDHASNHNSYVDSGSHIVLSLGELLKSNSI